MFAGLDNLDWLSLDEMKDLCPQMAIRIADEAPTSFEGSCQWVAARQMTDGDARCSMSSSYSYPSLKDVQCSLNDVERSLIDVKCFLNDVE